MVNKVFAIYDQKCEAYAPPFYMATIPMAIRAFADVANDPSTQISRHPEDYMLYMMGTFDNLSGKFESLKAPQYVTRGNEVKRSIGSVVDAGKKEGSTDGLDSAK